jgi:hypothetical protein
MLLTRNLIVAALMILANSTLSLADDDPKTAQMKAKILADKLQDRISKQSYTSDHVLSRVRIDLCGFSKNQKVIYFYGIYLPGSGDLNGDEEMKQLRDQLTLTAQGFFKEEGDVVRKNCQANIEGIEPRGIVAIANLLNVKLQSEANKVKLDDVLFDPVTFNREGKAVLTVRVGSEDALKELEKQTWKERMSESIKALKSHLFLKALQVPLVNDVQSALEAKLVLEAPKVNIVKFLDKPQLQNKLGKSSTTRIERVQYQWDTSNGKLSLRIVIDGVTLDNKVEMSSEKLNALPKMLWKEYWKPLSTLEVGELAKASSPPPEPLKVEPTIEIASDLFAHLMSQIAPRKDLDGVRVDGGSFDEKGMLQLQGIIPTVAIREKLENAIKTDFSNANINFKTAVTGGVSTSAMEIIPVAKLLDEMRDWAATDAEELILTRLYFNTKGELSLAGKYTRESDYNKIRDQLRILSRKPEYFRDGDPRRSVQFNNSDSKSDRDLVLRRPGFTDSLRTIVRNDQKTWSGVLIERGSFIRQNATLRYSLFGLVDKQEQVAELTRRIVNESKTPEWKEYFEAPVNESDIHIELMPMEAMIDRFHIVWPGYQGFDMLDLVNIVQDPEKGLEFQADTFFPNIFEVLIRNLREREAYEAKVVQLLKSLLEKHPKWKRRAQAGVILKLNVRAPQSKESRWLRPSFAAAELAKVEFPAAFLEQVSAIRHIPDSSATLFLSALYHAHIAQARTDDAAKGDWELVQRDLYRVIEMEGELQPAYSWYEERYHRYEVAKNIQGPVRHQVEELEHWLRREMRDGRRQIQLEAESPVHVPKRSTPTRYPDEMQYFGYNWNPIYYWIPVYIPQPMWLMPGSYGPIDRWSRQLYVPKKGRCWLCEP